MDRIIERKKLTINCINDNMLNYAVAQGYKIPYVSIKQYYGLPAIFIIKYKNGIIHNYEMNIYNKNKLIALYLM
jgi:hypothetical protein